MRIICVALLMAGCGGHSALLVPQRYLQVSGNSHLSALQLSSSSCRTESVRCGGGVLQDKVRLRGGMSDMDAQELVFDPPLNGFGKMGAERGDGGGAVEIDTSVATGGIGHGGGMEAESRWAKAGQGTKRDAGGGGKRKKLNLELLKHAGGKGDPRNRQGDMDIVRDYFMSDLSLRVSVSSCSPFLSFPSFAPSTDSALSCSSLLLEGMDASSNDFKTSDNATFLSQPFLTACLYVCVRAGHTSGYDRETRNSPPPRRKKFGGNSTKFRQVLVAAHWCNPACLP